MKKIIVAILITCLFCETWMSGIDTFAAQTKENLIYGDYVYSDIITGPCVVRHYNKLTRYNGRDKHVIVPDEINNIPVQVLMRKYKYPNQIEEITLGTNIEDVDGSFNALPNLKAINVLEGNGYFSSIDGILLGYDGDFVRYPRGKSGEKYTLPRNTTRVLSYAFCGCDNLQTIIVPEKVWDIHDGAFKKCENLTKITLPKSLMYIEENAFSGCSALQEIKIPKNVAMIKASAFKNCNAKIKMPSYIKKKKDSGNGAYYELRFKAKFKKKTTEYSFLEDFGDIKPAKKKIVLKKGKKEKLITKIYVDDVWQTLKTNMLYFSSSNKKVATVTNNGMVKSKKKGKTTITAYYYFGGEAIKYKVKVQVK